MKDKIFFIFILLFLFTACKKQVEKDRLEFIGEWHARISDYEFIVLTIDSNSYADYMIYWQGDGTDYCGIARANDRHLKIGRTKFFKIIEYPHLIDTTVEKHYFTNAQSQTKLANWKMVLDGMKPALFHVSGERTYYKADY